MMVKSSEQERGDVGTMAKCSWFGRFSINHFLFHSWNEEGFYASNFYIIRAHNFRAMQFRQRRITRTKGFEVWSLIPRRASHPIYFSQSCIICFGHGCKRNPPREPPESFGPAGPCRPFVSLGWLVELTWDIMIVQYLSIDILNISRWTYKYIPRTVIIMTMPCHWRYTRKWSDSTCWIPQTDLSSDG